MIDAPSPGDPRLVEMMNIVRELVPRESGPNEAGEHDDGVAAALLAARKVAEELRALRADAREAERRLDGLVQVIGNLVGLDYTQRAVVNDRGDVYDGFAYSLNLMAEELESSTVSREYVDEVVESLMDPLMVAASDGELKRVNRAACEMSGETAEGLMGRSIGSVFADIDAPALLACGGVSAIETVCLKRGGDTVAVSFSASVMRDRRGDVSGLVCVARDLTEIRRMEGERWKLREAMQRQSILLEELSTPLIPISADVLVMPLIGAIDDQRAQLLIEVLLNGIVGRQARIAIVDITGVRTVDERAMQGILKAVKAVRLVGAQALLTGIRPDVAMAILSLDLGSHDIETFGTLQDGIARAMQSIASTKNVHRGVGRQQRTLKL